MPSNPPIRPGQRSILGKAPGGKGPQRFALRMAEVIRVDYERMICDLKYLEGGQAYAREVPLSAAYWSARGFLGAMPGQGSIAIVGFYAAQQHHVTLPLILAFLPNGFRTALRYDPIGVAERNNEDVASATTALTTTALEGIYGPLRHKLKKLYPGDVYASSDTGGEILLSRGLFLQDRSGQSMRFDPDQGSLHARAWAHSRAGAWGRSHAGKIIRNALTMPVGLPNPVPQDDPIFDTLLEQGMIYSDGTWTPDMDQLPTKYLADGTKQGLITKDGASPSDANAQFFVEDRKELYLYENGSLPLDGISPILENLPDIFIEHVLGTVVGNDVTTLEGRRQYGQILRPRLFTASNSRTSNPGFDTIGGTTQDDLSMAAAYLYRMRRPDGLGEMFISHDREGHVFMSLPASRSGAGNLGAGRSLEADLRGSAKVVLGANADDTTSLNLDTIGGIAINAGTFASSQRSLDAFFEGGVQIVTRGADANGVALNIRTQGDVSIRPQGSTYVESSGDFVLNAAGIGNIGAQGLNMTVGTTGRAASIQGNDVETITGRSESVIQGGRTVSINTPLAANTNSDQLTIALGNREATFTGVGQQDNIRFVLDGTRVISSGTTLTYNVSAGGLGTFIFEAPTGTFNARVPRVNLGVGASIPVALATPLEAGLAASIVTLNTNLTAIAATITAAIGTGGLVGLPYVPVPVTAPTGFASTVTFTI